MENQLINALRSEEFPKVNRELKVIIRDILGNSANEIITKGLFLKYGIEIPVNFYTLLIKPILDGNPTFRDLVELENVAEFYDQIQIIPNDEKLKFIEKLEKEKDFEFTKRLLYSISLLNNLNKVKITSKLFISLAKEEITKEEFESLLYMIETINIHDLIYFKSRLDHYLTEPIFQFERKESMDRIDMLCHRVDFINEFKQQKNIFISNGLILEQFLIQNVERNLGNGKEGEEIENLRKKLTTTVIIYAISNRGALLYRYGLS